MKIALCTTTINVPHVLRLYRKAGPEVRFFVAVDKKTPDAAMEFLHELPNTQICQGDGWKCSDLIGWNQISRRNIAALEAIKWGANILAYCDDDNIPVQPLAYFKSYEATLNQEHRFNGLLASPEHDWFDAGQLYDPPASQRGIPFQIGNRISRFSFVTDAKIGAHAGLVINDPDISAITRIARAPNVHRISEVLRLGIAVDPKVTHTAWNTQNSAVIRELAPAMLLCPQFQRYDDIIGSIVCQRVMASTGHHVLFGPPICLQERNIHDLARDLAAEAWGNENILKIVSALWSTGQDWPLSRSVLDKVRDCYQILDKLMPGVSQLADVWCVDCERAM